MSPLYSKEGNGWTQITDTRTIRLPYGIEDPLYSRTAAIVEPTSDKRRSLVEAIDPETYVENGELLNRGNPLTCGDGKRELIGQGFTIYDKNHEPQAVVIYSENPIR